METETTCGCQRGGHGGGGGWKRWRDVEVQTGRDSTVLGTQGTAQGIPSILLRWLRVVPAGAGVIEGIMPQTAEVSNYCTVYLKLTQNEKKIFLKMFLLDYHRKDLLLAQQQVQPMGNARAQPMSRWCRHPRLCLSCSELPLSFANDFLTPLLLQKSSVSYNSLEHLSACWLRCCLIPKLFNKAN